MNRNSRHIIQSLKAKEDAKRTFFEKAADAMTSVFGSMTFFLLNVVFFAAWLLINTGQIQSIPSFDPYPFGLLTTIVSLEAIMLAIFVLISQNRASQVDDLREEIDLQVDIITEQELTKLIEMVAALMKKNGMDTSQDAVLASMIQPTNLQKIERSLERQVTEN